MILLKKPGLLLLISLLILIFSCSARIDGVVREGGAADITVKTSLEPRTIALIRSLRGFMGGAAEEPILDGPAISGSMAASPGVRAVSFKNTGPAVLDGSISLANVGEFLVAGGEKGSRPYVTRFISYTEGPGPGTSSIIATFDRNTAPELISRLSPEVEEYLSALMAPVVLGENSTRREYLDLLGQIYGRPLADEIDKARIRATIEFNRPLVAVKGGTSEGNRALFDISLADLLVLENPLIYEVRW